GTTLGLLHAREKEQEARTAADEERKAREREAEQAAIARQKEKDAQEEKTIAETQRERAEKARDRTRAVLDIMTSELVGDVLAQQGTINDRQKAFLKDVLSYYREFASE